MKKGSLSCAVFGSLFLALPCSAQQKAPEAFTTNCQACHLLDQEQVGPSLVAIAKLYPRKKRKDFIKWCVDPGKKRPEMAQMPSMAHIPADQLSAIHTYILSTTKNKSNRVKSKEDLYGQSPTAVARPRVTRTFLPETGPASILFALATTEKHNVVWDTNLCRMRYISLGEIDNYPYLRSNGNSLANVGEICYTEDVLFSGQQKRQFKGYQLNEDGYPTLLYSIGETKMMETISIKEGVITRHINASPSMPAFGKIKSSLKIHANMELSGNTLKITYTPR